MQTEIIMAEVDAKKVYICSRDYAVMELDKTHKSDWYNRSVLESSRFICPLCNMTIIENRNLSTLYVTRRIIHEGYKREHLRDYFTDKLSACLKCGSYVYWVFPAKGTTKQVACAGCGKYLDSDEYQFTAPPRKLHKNYRPTESTKKTKSKKKPAKKKKPSKDGGA
jgi:hypothetical protein